MEPAAVVEAILGRAEGDKTRLVQIRADKGASYGAIVTVIDELASNGLVHLALVSDRKAGAPTTAPASDPAMAAAPAAPAPAADAAAVATVASARNPASK
jgi:biopolymer transport protein ExbD/biopolymer transport protein TolR